MFEGNLEFEIKGPAYLAAKNVQCIHTSVLAGTTTRQCTQDWLLGNCGVSQPEALQTQGPLFNNMLGNIISAVPLDYSLAILNHDACTLFYISSFENDFPAVNNTCCPQDRSALPHHYFMGYKQRNKRLLQLFT